MSVADIRGEDPVFAALDALEVAVDTLIDTGVETLSHQELLQVLDRLERINCRLPVAQHPILNRLTAEANPMDLGASSLAKVLAFHLRITPNQAHDRIDAAADLGAGHTLSGQPLAPTLEHTAAAQARGQINTDHVALIRKFFAHLPDHVDAPTRLDAETRLAQIASAHGPAGLRQAVNLLLALLHPDGDYTDAERARRRSLTLGHQQVDGMSRLSGWITPELRATLEPILARWAAPGMCNPDDQQPTLDGEPDTAAVDRDTRTLAQRRHDALLAMGRNLLCSGQLGQHNGLPATIIVTTTLQELESGAGQALTAGGTRLPMADLIRLGSHSHHYLAVFDKHTEQALYLGRTRRCATGAQRIVLHARDRGCTRPGCTTPGYKCQAHHAVADWKNNGQTDIDDLSLACGPDNNLIEQSQWTTRKRTDGRTEWIPPPHLDTGQARVNDFHHPERMLHPTEGDADDDGP